jgi:phosphatidyl-myo-inositol alpha-mannosyltransferase
VTLPGRHLHVAIVADHFYPHVGGISEHVHHLALELTRRGHRVTVVSSRMRGRTPDSFREQYPVVRIGTGVPIYANGGLSRVAIGWNLRGALAGVLRDGRFDLIHVHGGLAPMFGTLAPFVARDVGMPLVATFHSWFPGSVGYRVFRRPLQRLADSHAANIAVSEAVVKATARYFALRWEIIPNGVDMTHFHPDGRGPVGAPEAGLRLLYLHRLEPRNHLRTLLGALPAIVARHPGTVLTIAGDGPWRRHYQRLARPLGGSVRFVGRVEDRPRYYRDADLYLCPTMRAAFGVTLLEAMACGTPMVVADNPGFRAVAGGGEAVIVPHDQPAAWAEAVMALARDVRRRSVMGALGMATAARYAWPLVAERILQVYRKAVG